MEIKINGLYKHYKGNTYRVIALATHTETMEPMVIYRDENNPEKVWARPARMWNETVLTDGRKVLRFTEIGESYNPQR